ncbi:hypothetical protein ABSA28_00450 [Candidatus Hepatincolaceae symbiont of Richtersius coronifer]
MSLKINFFPLHFIVSLLLLVSGVIIFNDTIYIWMSSNIYINSLILTLFIVCIMWILGVLSYYSRSTRVLNKLLGVVNPDVVLNNKRLSNPRKQAMYVASSIAGTLIDSPIASRILATSLKTGKLDISNSEATLIVDAVKENGERVINPSRFLTSLFTMLGLLGTFLGLLQTIDGVGRALAALSSSAIVDVLSFVKLLADPLQGMAVAFSTSLFGLVCALFGNYGNYVASQKLAILSNKLKNFLTASSGIMASEPDKIEAKDILISLDDSFNRLYTGLADKLDSVTDGIIGLSKAVVRTQERQEKILKVIVDSFATMEEMWEAIPEMAETLKKITTLPDDMRVVLKESRVDFYSYLDNNFLPILDRISLDIEEGNEISTDILDSSEDVYNSSQDSLREVSSISGISANILNANAEAVNVSKNVFSAVDGSAGILSGISALNLESNVLSKELINVNLNHTAVARRIADLANYILDKIPGAEYTDVVNAILNELSKGNNLSTSIANELTNANVLARAAVGELTAINAASNFTAGNVDIIKNLNDEIRNELSAISNISSNILSIIPNYTPELNALGEIIDSGNQIKTMIAGELSKISNLSFNILNKLPAGEETVNFFNNMGREILVANNLSNNLLTEVHGISLLSQSLLSEVINGNGSASMLMEEVSRLSNTTNAILENNKMSNEISGMVNNNVTYIGTVVQSLSEGLLEANGVSRALLDAQNQSILGSREINNNLLSLLNSFAEGNQISNEILASLVGAMDISSRIMDSLSNISTNIVAEITNGINSLSGVLANNTFEYIGVAREILEVSNNSLVQLDALTSNSYLNLEGIRLISNSLNSLPTALEGITTSVNNSLVGMEDIGFAIRNDVVILRDTFQEFGVRFFDIASIFQENVASLSNAAFIANSLEQRITSLNDALANLMPILNNVIISTDRGSDSIAMVLDTIIDLGNRADIVDTSINNLSDTIANETSRVFEQLTNLGNIATNAGNSMINSLDTTLSLVEDMNSRDANVQANILELVNEFGDLKDTYSSQIVAITDQLSLSLESILNSFDSMSQNIFDVGRLVDKVDNFLDRSEVTQSEAFNRVIDELSAMRNIQSQFSSALEGEAKFVFSNVFDGIREFADKLSDIQDSLRSQTIRLESVDGSLINFSEYRGNFLDDVVVQYKSLQDMISDLVSNFHLISNNLTDVTFEISKQSDAMEKSIDVGNMVSNSLLELSRSNEYLIETSNMIKSTADTFLSFNETLDRLDKLVNSQESVFKNLAENIDDDIVQLSNIIADFADMLSKRDDLPALYRETAKLTSVVNEFVTKFDQSIEAALLSNGDANKDLANSLEGLSQEIVEIRNYFTENLSNTLLAEISKFNGNQSAMINSLEEIMPALERNLSTFTDSANNGAGNPRVVEALTQIKNEYATGNARLNVIANAMDALITEMLNSRDVTQSILDMVYKFTNTKDV